MKNIVQDEDLTLALNACERELQIVVLGSTQIYVAESWNIANYATEILAPQLHEIIKTLKISVSDLKKIACVGGPGSFTGIRLVLTTALGLARCTQCQLANLNYLEALAYEANLRHEFKEDSNIFVATHARINLLHVQKFQFKAHKLVALSDVQLLSPTSLLAELHATDYVVSRKMPDYLDQTSAKVAHFISDVTSLSFAVLAQLARQANYSNNDLEPLYIRHCDAEDNLDTISAKQGVEAKTARSALDHYLHEQPKSLL